MTVWRMHLRSEGKNPAEFCIQHEIVGIGWGITHSKPVNADEYLSLGKEIYGSQIGWRRAANAVIRRMAVGDLVWVRDLFGIYFLGRISGDWEYRDAPEYKEADIFNIRPCKLCRVGASVAGKIVGCFRPAATVQQIDDDTSRLFSNFMYNKLTGEHLPLIYPSNIDVFSLLSDVDLEDVVGLYLQHEKGLLFVPSSRSRQNTTMSYEYQLVDPHSGQFSCVQVKSGNIILDPGKYYNSQYIYYLFSPAGYTGPSTQESVVCLKRSDIDVFLNTSRRLLPLNVSAWLDMMELLVRNL